MHNHIFVWAQEFMRSRTKYCLGFYEISYKILFGILRDFVRDIVWDFCEISYELSHVEYNGRGFVTNVSNTESKHALITGAWS